MKLRVFPREYRVTIFPKLEQQHSPTEPVDPIIAVTIGRRLLRPTPKQALAAITANIIQSEILGNGVNDCVVMLNHDSDGPLEERPFITFETTICDNVPVIHVAA